MSGLELTRTYSIGIKGLQYIGDGPIGYVKECTKREFGFNTREETVVIIINKNKNFLVGNG